MLIVLAITVQTCFSCLCPRVHPQTAYCNSDFGKLHSSLTVTLDLHVMLYSYTKDEIFFWQIIFAICYVYKLFYPLHVECKLSLFNMFKCYVIHLHEGCTLCFVSFLCYLFCLFICDIHLHAGCMFFVGYLCYLYCSHIASIYTQNASTVVLCFKV